MDVNISPDLAPRVLSITRVFKAPRARVFAVFVDARQMAQWLGPTGYTMTHLEADLRPGGIWRGCMKRTGDGHERWHGGVYREIVPDERIIFTFAFEEDGAPRTLVTVTFEDRGEQTLMHFSQDVLETSDDIERYRSGWESEFDQLAGLLGRN